MLGFIFGDITKVRTEAIVNAANTSLLGGGGVDGAIHRAAGPGLLEECRKFHGCRTGEARITKGYDLPSEWVIHTPGPVWQDGMHGEEGLLRSCYRNSLELCREHGIRSVAFPLISAGAYGYPKDEALLVAISEIESYLGVTDIEAYMVIYSKSDLRIPSGMLNELRRCRIDMSPLRPVTAGPAFPSVINDLLERKDLNFGEVYRRSNMTSEECTNALTHMDYVPDRNTVIKASFALELSAAEMLGYLEYYGYSYSPDDRRDSVTVWFLDHGIWSVPRLNAALIVLGLDQV